MSISLILLIIAGILALLDIVLGFARSNGRAFYLTPAAVLLVVIALVVAGGSVHA
jgi:uncharacterized membrane protein